MSKGGEKGPFLDQRGPKFFGNVSAGARAVTGKPDTCGKKKKRKNKNRRCLMVHPSGLAELTLSRRENGYEKKKSGYSLRAPQDVSERMTKLRDGAAEKGP